MKKSIIALMGLFTLVACSEDSYQEADKMNETVNVDNGSGSQNSIKTVGTYYNSPFEPYGTSLSLGTMTRFINNTHLSVELIALAAEHDYNHTPITGYNFYESAAILMKPFSNEINQDVNAPMSIVISTPTAIANPAMSYDFGNYSDNYWLHHFGKVHCFKYIIRSETDILAEGYIKQRFFDDVHDYNDVRLLDRDWVFYTNITGIPGYDLAVMYNNISNEVCLTNDLSYPGAYLPSTVNVSDPLTATTHTLDFYTDAAGVYVTFN